MNTTPYLPSVQTTLYRLSELTAPRFSCEQVRSLTVHLEHAGEWRVETEDRHNGERVTFPAYFPTWESAHHVEKALNAAWRAVPNARPWEVLAFIIGQDVSPVSRFWLYSTTGDTDGQGVKLIPWSVEELGEMSQMRADAVCAQRNEERGGDGLDPWHVAPYDPR